MTRIIKLPKWYERDVIKKFQFRDIGCDHEEYEHYPIQHQIPHILIICILSLIPCIVFAYFLIGKIQRDYLLILLEIFSLIISGVILKYTNSWLRKYFIIQHAWKSHVGNRSMICVGN